MNGPAQPPAEQSRPPGVPASFALVWDAIADIIGTAATAALVRRAVKRTAAQYPTLEQLRVERRAFTPEYVLPPSWIADPTGGSSGTEFQALFDELLALLRQLTGTVVLRRLAQLSLPSFGRPGGS